MALKNKKWITEKDYIKANRKASRDEEIAAHGKPVPRTRVHKSKKMYDRKRQKLLTRRSLPSHGEK